MERKDFLQGIGIISAGTLLSQDGKIADAATSEAPFACTLTPSETSGPYPYPGTISSPYASSPLYRSNIIGDLPVAGGGGTISGGVTAGGGIVLTLTLTVQNTSCTTISGARVDIWHCDKRGYYSAYSSTQNGGDWTGYTFLRGIQTTDSNGQVTFTSIFPSWYIPRAIHFHIQVYINDTLYSTTQLAIDDSLGVTINGATGYNRTYTFTNATDQVFSDGFSNQLLTVTGSNTAGYVATGTVIVDYTALPLTLLAFKATIENRQVWLSWTSENEENLSRFDIQRAAEGTGFTTTGTVTANNRPGTNNYSFNDPIQAGVSYYRLKIIDTDGKFTYSNVVTVNGGAFQHIKAYPNPAVDKIIITHQKTDSTTWVKIFNIAGMLIATSKLPAGISVSNFDVSAFAPGTYLLVIESSTGKSIIKFTKQ